MRPIPARRINEVVYCPRLFALEHLDGEWADNAHTVRGQTVHRRVDVEGGALPEPDGGDDAPTIARSVSLSDEALGITATGWVLQLFGYVPNVEQSARTLLGIRLFFGPVPLIFFALALPLLIWYPITRKRHGEMRRMLAKAEGTEA